MDGTESFLAVVGMSVICSGFLEQPNIPTTIRPVSSIDIIRFMFYPLHEIKNDLHLNYTAFRAERGKNRSGSAGSFLDLFVDVMCHGVPVSFSSENQATIHSVLFTTVFCEKIRTYQIMYPARTPTCPQLSQLFQ